MKPYRLGDGCSITHGFAFSGMVESDSEGVPIVVNIGNFKYSGGFRFESTKIQRFEGEFPERFRLAAGDVLLVMTCQTAGGEILGIPGRIPADGKTYLHNQRMGKVVVTRPHELDLGYLYYLFLSPRFNAHLVATATGSKILHTAPARIENFVWPRPTLPVQQRIADILSAYDDLIENNTKRINILEEIARSLYREWFVNFRFPDHGKVKMVNSALGKVPEGWDASTLGAHARIVMGQAPKSEFYNETGDGLPFHQGVTHFGSHFPTHRAWCTSLARTAEPGDILFSVRAPVGRINFAPDRLVVGRGLSAIRHKHDAQALVWLQIGERVQEDSMGGGTIFKAVTKEDVHRIPWLEPSAEVRRTFERSAGTLLRQIELLTKKQEVLARTRDLLLPRLISGQIPVEARS